MGTQSGGRTREAAQAIGTIASTFFAAFDNRGGAHPDFARLKSLFVPEAIIVKCGEPNPPVLSVEEFLAPRERLLTDGTLTEFWERELWHDTRIFGQFAHRFSSYEKSGRLGGQWFEARGMKSLQFIRISDAAAATAGGADAGLSGWRLTAVVWDDEREGCVVPAECLPEPPAA